MGYIKNHWNGDQPLVQAFWVNNVLLAIVLYIVWSLIGSPILVNLARAGKINGVIAVLLIWMAISFTISVWMIVGVWRSAGVYKFQKHKARESSTWGTVAQVLVVLAAIGLLYNLIVSLILLGRLAG